MGVTGTTCVKRVTTQMWEGTDLVYKLKLPQYICKYHR